MKRNGSLRDVGFYVLIAILLIVSIFILRGGMNTGDNMTYGQVRRLLEQQQVTKVELDNKTVTLWLKEAVGGKATVTYDVANPQWFYNDFNDLIVEQMQLGIIQDYDYPAGFEPPFWVSFLPWKSEAKRS